MREEKHHEHFRKNSNVTDRLPKGHRLSASMEAVIIGVSAANEAFAGHKIALASDPRRNALDQRLTLREAFVSKYGRDLIRAREPMTKARKAYKARDAALVIQDIDYAGIDTLAKQTQALADGRRRERICEYFLRLEPTMRIAKAMSGDLRILDAIVREAPELSGFDGFDRKIIDDIEQRYRELAYPAQLAKLAEDNAVIELGEAAEGIALNEMRTTIDPDMHQHDFSELMRPIAVNKPWLVDDDKQVCEIDPATGHPTYRLADDSDRANGVKYPNFEAYKAAQQAA